MSGVHQRLRLVRNLVNITNGELGASSASSFELRLAIKCSDKWRLKTIVHRIEESLRENGTGSLCAKNFMTAMKSIQNF